MTFSAIISAIDNFIWGWPLIILLFGTHIFMTFRTGFIQKDIFKAIKLSVTKDPDAEGDVSQFGALTTALPSPSAPGILSASELLLPVADPERCSGCGLRVSSELQPSMQRR